MVYGLAFFCFLSIFLVLIIIRQQRDLAKSMGNPEDLAREMEMTQSQLMRIAQHAGMAELNQGILKNIYNILSTVNVSTSVVGEKVRKMDVRSLERLANLLEENKENLGDFITKDEKGKKLPMALTQLSEFMRNLHDSLTSEVNNLTDIVQKLNQIVKAQQAYAGAESLEEEFDVNQLLEDAILMESRTFEDKGCSINQAFAESLPKIKTHKIKLLQVAVTLLRNGSETINQNRPPGQRSLLVRTSLRDREVSIEIGDEAALKSSEIIDPLLANTDSTTLTRRYFSLYYSASAVAEMHGKINIFAEGLGYGSLVRVDLPIRGR